MQRTFRAQDAEQTAADALSFIANDPALLDRFLALSGIAPEHIRRAAAEPGFLAGVLDFLLGHEPDLLAFAARSGRGPGAVVAARAQLAGEASA